MSYEKQTWVDSPAETTPLSASRLNHIEQGIYDASLVTANPSGTATDDLTKIQIGQTIYDVEGGTGEVVEMTYAEYRALTPEQKMDGTVRYVSDYPSGGGSGAGYSETVLFTSGGVTVTDMVLSDSFNNYDAICIVDEQNSQASERLRSTTIYPSSILNSHIGSSRSFMTAYSGSGYFWSFNVISDTLLRATSFGAKNRNPVSVLGIKYGGGSSYNFSTTEVNTGQKWIDGKDIYCIVIADQHVQCAANTFWVYSLTSLNIDSPLWYFARMRNTEIVFPWVTDWHDGNRGTKYSKTEFGIRGKQATDFEHVDITLWYTKN